MIDMRHERRIMKCGCLKWKTDKQGLTAFMQAAKLGHLDCLEALLPRSDPQATEDRGWTALTHSTLHGDERVLSFLIPLSDPNAQDDTEMTPLMFAACFGNEKAVRALLPVTDLALANFQGMTALELAEKHGNAACAEMIRAYTLSEGEKALFEELMPSAKPSERRSIDD